MTRQRFSVLFPAAVILAIALAPVAGGAVLPTDFADQLVVGGFTQSTSFDFLPDGRILVIEKPSGKVWLVVNGVKGASPILTLTDVNTGGFEQGLLGIAIDPGWPSPPYVFLYYDRTPGNMIYIVRYTASGDLSNGASTNLSLAGRYLVITDIPDWAPNHNAGTLRFGEDGMLYASLGDDASNCTAQDSTDFRGKIIRFDVSALPDTGTGPPSKSLLTPPDNPFPPTDPELGLVYCFGLRNPYRFHIDPVGGGLYIGDVGESHYEEVDQGFGGENFGWPFREGPEIRLPGSCSEPGGSGAQTYVSPIAYYNRSGLGSASVIGWPRYRPVAGGAYSFPALYNGVVFYSDYYGQFVRTVRNVGGVWAPLDSVPGQPSAANWATGVAEVSDTRIGPDGAIYYTTLFPGSLRRIVFTGDSTGIGNEPPLRPVLAARPNPFHRGDRITLEIQGAAGSPISLRVYSAGGRLVRTLTPGGGGGITWDGRDETGRDAAPGVYVVSGRWTSGSASVRVVLTP